MRPCFLSMAFAICGMMLHSSLALSAEVQIHKGTVVSASHGRLVIKDRTGQEQTHLVNQGTKITIHGQPGRLEQLEPTMPVRVATEGADKVVSISTVDDEKHAPVAE